MKILLILGTGLTTTLATSCQEIKSKQYAILAEVKDENHKPIIDAIVTGGSEKIDKNSPVLQANYESVTATTDTTGKTKLIVNRYSGVPSGALIQKEGYYTTRQPIIWTMDMLDKSPPQAEMSSILKKVKNPVPMYAYSNMGEMDKIANIANFGKEYGFDLMLSEPLPPLGNGKQADFLFMLQGKYDEKSVYEMSLRIRFPNPHDGIVEFMTLERDGMREPNMYGSELLSDYQAPEGGYISEVLRTTKKSIGEKTAFRDDDFRRNYYFRVRSEVDESGRITKANYGKIYGDFHFFAANKDWGYLATLALVTTYYNPNNNDRNVEFDPKRNLLPSGNVQRP